MVERLTAFVGHFIGTAEVGLLVVGNNVEGGAIAGALVGGAMPIQDSYAPDQVYSASQQSSKVS